MDQCTNRDETFSYVDAKRCLKTVISKVIYMVTMRPRWWAVDVGQMSVVATVVAAASAVVLVWSSAFT